MKTLPTTLIGAFAALMICLAPTSLSAQTTVETCLPDCDTIPWSAPAKTLVNVGSNCWLRITYAYRTACGWNDVTITSMEMFGAGCAGRTAKEFLSKSLDVLLLQNPMGWSIPDQDSCLLDDYRFIRPACWENLWDSVWVPCDSVGCCITYFDYCRDPQYRAEQTSVTLIEPCDSTSDHCEEVCELDTTSANRSRLPDIGYQNARALFEASGRIGSGSENGLAEGARRSEFLAEEPGQ